MRWTFEKTWHKLCDDTVESVRCGHERVTESAYDSVTDPLFRAQARLDRAQQEQKRASTQGPFNQLVSQVAVTWRSHDKRKLTLTKSYVAPELIVIVQIDLRREEMRRDIS